MALLIAPCRASSSSTSPRARSEPLPTPAGTTLAGIDGLYVVGRSLVGVQNGFAGPQRVVQAFLADGEPRVTCVDVLERQHPDYDVPTTGVVVGETLDYVAGSQLNRQDEKGDSRDQSFV